MMKDNLKNLAEEIIVSYDARVKMVGEIVEDTHKILDGFKEKRQEMSDNLREVLAKSESLRKKDFSAMMQDILLTQHRREENVKKMLADFREEEARVAERLRELLKKGEELRLADFKKTLVRIRQDQAGREANTGEQVRVELTTMQSEVYKMLEVFKKEREAAASEWEKVRELLAEKKTK
jgi:nucleoid DNA-binding protein